MCNDVEKIASFLLSNKCEEKRAILEANKHHSEKKEEVKIEIVDLNELNGIAIGDSVEWKKNGKKMRVVSIKSNGIYECELGSMVLKFNFEDIKK